MENEQRCRGGESREVGKSGEKGECINGVYKRVTIFHKVMGVFRGIGCMQVAVGSDVVTIILYAVRVYFMYFPTGAPYVFQFDGIRLQSTDTIIHIVSYRWHDITIHSMLLMFL
jgi:hypothetical protein